MGNTGTEISTAKFTSINYIKITIFGFGLSALWACLHGIVLPLRLLDFVPESLALGGAFALGIQSAPLLALFIGLQNIPEGFNAYRELRSTQSANKRPILVLMMLLVPLGPIIAIIGWIYLKEHVLLLGATMLFASGGILYLIFQDIKSFFMRNFSQLFSMYHKLTFRLK